MLFQQAWNRFFKNFGRMLLVGLVSNLIWMVPGGLIGVAFFVKIFGFLKDHGLLNPQPGFQPDPSLFLSLIGTMMGMSALAMILVILVMPFVTTSQLQAVRHLLLDEPVDVGRALQGGKRFWARGLGYILLMGLCIQVASMVLFVVNIVPILGQLAWLLGIMMLNIMFIYGLYALVADDLGVIDAFTQAWRLLFQRFGEHAAAAGSMLLIYLCMVIPMGLLAFIPVLGWLVDLGIFMVMAPFFLTYLGVRYEAMIRPTLGGPSEPPPYPGV